MNQYNLLECVKQPSQSSNSRVDDWNNNKRDVTPDLVICVDDLNDEHQPEHIRANFLSELYNNLLVKIKTIDFSTTNIHGAACSPVLTCRSNVSEIWPISIIVFVPTDTGDHAVQTRAGTWVSYVFVQLTRRLDEVPLYSNFFTAYMMSDTMECHHVLFSLIAIMGRWIETTNVGSLRDTDVSVYTSPQSRVAVVTAFNRLSPRAMEGLFDLVDEWGVNQEEPPTNQQPINTQNSSRFGSKKKKKKKKKKNKKPIQETTDGEQITECNICLEEDEDIAWQCKTCKRGMICVKCIKPWMRTTPDHKCPCCRS